ncbi:MAG: MraY family glycosyltransferase [Eubacteriales bacterium]
MMFGAWSYPITVLWIVGLTNAVNLIDGLDGLACGVSAIGGFSLLLVTIVLVDPSSTLLAAIFAGSCLGFIPFNTNPAKIFMGDTGAMFLGFTLSVMSIQGVFKLHAVLSFIVPFLIFGLPIFDSVFATFRRILTGRSPFSPDRGHIHHRLIDLGLNQKQSVRVLYAISGMLGISAVMMTSEHLGVSILIITTGIIIGIVNWTIFKKEAARTQSGLFPTQSVEAVEKSGEDEVKDEKN